jgi:hypothetical protein
MKFTSKEFLWIQAAIILLLLATMDCIVRGPMELILQQQQHLLWLRQATSCQGIEYLHEKVRLLELKQFEIEERIYK